MKNIRLPKHIRPERYQLTIKPDLEGFTFEGEETIYITLNKSLAEITLHSKELKIGNAEYKSKNEKFKSNKITYNIKAETVTVSFSKKLPKGRGELRLKFKGVLNNNMRGFYRSRYTHNGKEKNLATTQFEATDARRAFPCFDEPAQKAIFDVTIMVPPNLTAISNTIETSIKEHSNGYKLVEFAPTPKMSTYLLAFIVGEFEFIEGQTQRGVRVRVFVTPGKKHQAKFALSCAIRTLDFYEKYFDINYPLSILDMVAIPDFSHGAMENWGAVTYRESALLVDEENSSAANKQWVALVIAHELAHQWFGNLVTMHWWTDLWLNEGFASYIEYLAVDHLFPNWDIWTQFAYADLGVAFRLDGLASTHPIEIEVHNPDEIGEIFDEVSYSKGASIIRMLADFLGEKNFRNGLRQYLKKHAYQNTRTSDLWAAFEKASGQPVARIMQNWTGRGGYPIIKVTQRPKELILKQSRFFYSPVSKKRAADKTVWHIPLLYKSPAGEKKLLMDAREIKLKISSDSWLKLNFGESGFFRTDYPSPMLQNLQAPVRQKKLAALDRLGLIRDAFALAESQDLPATQALELIKGYTAESDYTVWTEISSGLSFFDQMLFGNKSYEVFQEFSRDVFKKLAGELGWQPKKGESHTTGLLRSLALANLGLFGDQAVIKKAREIFAKGKISPDIRGAVYQIVASSGGEKEFKIFLEKYRRESLHEEKNRLGRALGAFRQAKILSEVLKFSLSQDVRLQDAPSIIAGVAINAFGREIAWQFIKKNWKELNKRYPSSGHMLSRLLKPFGWFSRSSDLANLKNFFKTHPSSGLKQALLQVEERIESNVLWVKNQVPKLENWLSKN